jgi:lipoate-protein ligase A
VTAGVLPVWWDDAADGPTNMAADELLAEEADRRGGPVIRLYSWTEPTVSLGGFQRLVEAESCAAISGLPIVRRPSGGGAIIHGTDLTYAAAVPKSHPWGGTPQALYDAMHAAMVAALGELGFDARLHVPSDGDPPADALLCFSRRSPGDVVIRRPGGPAMPTDPKVMGSAQRRLGTTVLQHGSLLLTACLGVGGEARHEGLRELAGPPADWTARSLADRWTTRVAEAVEIVREFQPAPFTGGHLPEVTARALRFRDPRWTGRR